MPRRWTNSGGGGGSAQHVWPSPAPVRMTGKDGPVNLKEVEDILWSNAKIAGLENPDKKRFRK